MPLGTAVTSFQDGVGRTLGFIAVVLGLGTMLGKLRTAPTSGSRFYTACVGLPTAALAGPIFATHLASGGESDCQTA